VSRPIPLGVLDLVPVISGSTAGDALRNTIDLARTTEAAGYRRYWFAEHHLNPGVAGSSPAVLIALVASSTERIRLGSGGVQSGHRTALSVVEEFGLIDALHPGRLDLGVGRSGGRNYLRNRVAGSEGETPARPKSEMATVGARRPPRPQGRMAANGLVIPPRPSLKHLMASPRLRLNGELLQQANAETADYGDLVGDIVGLLRGTYRSEGGLDPGPVPGRGAEVEVWILGSSAGQSATVAGQLGLRYAANYHVSPSTVLEAADGYRAAFVPSEELERPYVAVSADVVVGPDDATARRRAAGFARWVLSIRRGEGAIPFPSPEEAAAYEWTDEDRALVADRVDTQFVGSAATVAAGLRRLQEATDADELLITTITHDHAERVRSYQLLAEEWFAAS
jgi:alkanesulfonate monooxygenase SsuD/methylene tetrahydromethanopterin reductase-like flavin-dependent oxidoreductase (luciferase family)